ncbi:MAG: sensor histidine kinase [Halodesulfurarchaeum sp.]
MDIPVVDRSGHTGVVILSALTLFLGVLHSGLAPTESNPVALLLGNAVSIVVLVLLGFATWTLWRSSLDGKAKYQVAKFTILGLGATLVAASGAIAYQEFTTPEVDLWHAANLGYVSLIFVSMGCLAGWFIGWERVHRNRQYHRTLEANRDHERTAKRLKHLASILSHDIRNPLTVARGRLGLVEEECDSPHIDAINRALDRIDAILEESVLLTRETRDEDDIRPVELGRIARAAWESVETGDVDLVVETEMTVPADPTSLRHVFENLFGNAIQHGGTDVSTVSVGSTGGGFFVEDDGIGFAASTGEELFVPGTSTDPAGTGLGLSIVKTIAESHDWSVQATAADGGGARFEFDTDAVNATDTDPADHQ